MDQVNSSIIQEEHEFLIKHLKIDFGDYWQRLYNQCFEHDGNRRPLYFTHVPLALSTFSITSLQKEIVEDLNIGYVYLTASYYALDSVVDKDKRIIFYNGLDKNVVELPVFLSASLNRFSKAILKVEPYCLSEFIEYFAKLMQENAQALYEESLFRSLLNEKYDYSLEYFHMWARSNLFLLPFQISGLLSNRAIGPELLNGLKSFLYYMQWGDDIGDWRQDYHQRKWTPFLRNCYHLHGPFTSEKELEEIIYFSGTYENSLEYIEQGFQTILDILKDIPQYYKLFQFIQFQRLKANQLILSFTKAKSNFN